MSEVSIASGATLLESSTELKTQRLLEDAALTEEVTCNTASHKYSGLTRNFGGYTIFDCYIRAGRTPTLYGSKSQVNAYVGVQSIVTDKMNGLEAGLWYGADTYGKIVPYIGYFGLAGVYHGPYVWLGDPIAVGQDVLCRIVRQSQDVWKAYVNGKTLVSKVVREGSGIAVNSQMMMECAHSSDTSSCNDGAFRFTNVYSPPVTAYYVRTSWPYKYEKLSDHAFRAYK